MKEYIQGVAIGFIMVSLMFFLEMILGFLQINFKQITISLLKDILVISLLITLFQSAFEELFFRGYIFQNLIESTNKLFAIILLSVLFGIGHMLTPNSSWIVAINLSMFGVMHAIAYLKTRSLFLASGLHFSWNFSMRNIYSLPVSGTGSSHSFLEVQVKGPEWITGSNYGPEAGIPALLLMIICSLIIWYSPNIKIETNIKNHWEEYKAKYIFNGNN